MFTLGVQQLQLAAEDTELATAMRCVCVLEAKWLPQARPVSPHVLNGACVFYVHHDRYLYLHLTILFIQFPFPRSLEYLINKRTSISNICTYRNNNG